MGKRRQDGEEWAVVDVVTAPDGMSPLERAGLGGDWKGEAGGRPLISQETRGHALYFEKEQEASVAGVVVGWVRREFMGIKEIKEGFQLSLEGSVFLEFLEARRAGERTLAGVLQFHWWQECLQKSEC